ncbi:MAG: DUF885 domain-containing protein [Sphingomonadales bacterium]|nr:MAG: DUF885 domain-containing protein [Sphingomonadales bacterium]
MTEQGPMPEADAVLASLTEELLRLYPENAAYLGIDKDDRAALKMCLTDRSPRGVDDLCGHVENTLNSLQRIDRTAASPAMRLDLDVVETAYGYAREGLKFGFGEVACLNVNLSHRSTPYVVAQNTGAFIEVPEFLDSQHGIADGEEADAYIGRLHAYGTALVGEAERIRADSDAGIVLPDFLLRKTIAQLKNVRGLSACDWQVVTSLARRTGLDLAKHIAVAERIVDGELKPALDRQIEALENAMPAATADAGVWKLAEGEHYYDWALRASTTTAVRAEEVHAMGAEQLRSLHAHMDPLLRKHGLTQGSVPDRMAAMATDPANLYANDDEGRAALLDYIDDRLAYIRTRMPDAFDTLVPGNVAVKRISPAIEHGAPDGYAGPGSLDGSNAGIYYINLRDTAIWPRHALPTLTFHEAIPGHIWQGEYANQLPLARSLLSFNAYSEGWALYAEQLSDELGAYEDDDLGRLGYLQSLAFRACRLVVDTGIHAMRWTREQAIDWFVANNGSPREQVAGEVDRYCVWPAQACSYKIGHSHFGLLRETARQRLGSKFSTKAFNDMLVQSGNVPLSILTRSTEAFVERHLL